ncbi:ribosylglycohydrolase [Streptomyces griseomycini]|nr:ADP-ribosylglycohydrolase family protein [Streptomyces griseomycini]GGP88998.1 ribosylglycohydrolase [Streptomyces griseomycini]
MGAGREPGEATDDPRRAVLVAASLLACGGLELPDVFRRFQRWAAAGPKDVDLQTEAVLSSGDPWDTAAALHFQVSRRVAGNGAMGAPPCSSETESSGERAAPSAVYFARLGGDATVDAARRLAAPAHGDRAAREGAAVLHELVRVALAGDDPLAAVADALRAVRSDHRDRYAAALAPDRHPDLATEFNGAVRPCPASAVRALRTTTGYEDAVRAAIDLGGDTDTVAAVSGGPAGAVHGTGAVPTRWTEALRVPLPGFGGRVPRAADPADMADRLETGPGRAGDAGLSGRPLPHRAPLTGFLSPEPSHSAFRASVVALASAAR